MKKMLLLLSAVLLLAGCDTALRNEERAAFTLGVVLKTMDAEHWMEIRSGMERAANEHHIRLILQSPGNELAEAEQDIILRDILAEPIDALLFSPCNSDDTLWLAEEAAARDLPLFAVDTDTTDSVLPYIGSNNREIGRMAYEYLLEQLGPGQRVGIITGTSRQRSLSDRVSGLRFYCSRDEKLEVGCIDTGCNSYADAYHAARRQLQEEAVSAIFCTSGVLGMGAVTAREELGRGDVLLIAVDTQDDVLNALREGRLDALITQSGYEIGCQAVEEAFRCLSGGTPQQNLFIGNELLTAENIDAFTEKREEP